MRTAKQRERKTCGHGHIPVDYYLIPLFDCLFCFRPSLCCDSSSRTTNRPYSITLKMAHSAPPRTSFQGDFLLGRGWRRPSDVPMGSLDEIFPTPPFSLNCTPPSFGENRYLVCVILYQVQPRVCVILCVVRYTYNHKERQIFYSL